MGDALRAGWQCDCDGVDKPVRLRLMREDPSAYVHNSMRAAVGGEPSGCPWRAFHDPFVGAVLRAYRHWKANQLHLLYRDPPAALMVGIEVYDAALNAVQAHDLRQEREKREQERKRNDLNRKR